jgi:glucokinase
LARRFPYLLADIGGTNTRIALGGVKGAPSHASKIANDEVDDIRVELSKALRAAGEEKPQYGVIAAAGPIDCDHVRLTNRDWRISRAELERVLDLDRIVIVNDFVAMAHAVDALAPDDLLQVGGSTVTPDGNLLVCGPGTGFGAAARVRDAERTSAIASEAGHMRLGATTDDEARIFRNMAANDGTLSVEGMLSGRGLVALHRCLHGEDASSGQVIADAVRGDRNALETVTCFLRVFGRVVGDLCLVFNANAAYLAGGISRALAPLYAASPFREALEDHPPYRVRLRSIPVFVVTHEAPGLVGALQIARSKFPESLPPAPRSAL